MGEQQQDEQQQPETALSAGQADTLLKADLRNITRKLNAGKTLSAGERKLLLSIQTGGKGSAANFASSIVELASILGVSPKTIHRARKKPGNPGVRPDSRLDVAAWREYLRQTSDCIDDTENDYGLEKARQSARKLLLQNESLETDLAIKRKQWMPIPMVEKMGGELGVAIRKVVLQLHLCAHSVVGVSVAEAETILKEVEQEALQQLHQLDQTIEKYKDQVEQPPA
jgi:hypothetical protein